MILCNGGRISIAVPTPRIRMAPPAAPKLLVVPVVGPRGADGSGATNFTATAATILSGHRVVRADNAGAIVLASNTDVFDATADLWLTTGAASSGQPVELHILGRIVEPSWSWSPGPVWLGADGLLTQTLPAPPAAQFLRQVGTADGPTALYFNPRSAIAY